ncbi:hypothetical protein ASPSYDRAFT_135229 [Aspergillus sydowii CBS 593.65]|uniref:Uncharacterized protein n=1 Tax=Aspergillus sydowii CBS 593.65 TaxID=1036612 RepID=A0A1L9T8I8_9EURO|nr:uncharacterized protein ASPSYDRAFT_135229 [Aspergillus sydowii CBS 593.65]OJJ55603.1 hypothetical protein ASPSYDRAFT_135229 [Aspergillus sydowii CBS 593.65]
MADAPVKAYAVGLTRGCNFENCRYKIIASDRKTLDTWANAKSDAEFKFEIVNPFWFKFDQEYSDAIAESENFPSEVKGQIIIQRLPDMARSVVKPPTASYSYKLPDGTRMYVGGRNGS